MKTYAICGMFLLFILAACSQPQPTQNVEAEVQVAPVVEEVSDVEQTSQPADQDPIVQELESVETVEEIDDAELESVVGGLEDLDW